jgi:hypothetical protein
MAFIGGLDRKDHFQTGHGTRGGPTLRMRKMPKWMNYESDIQRVLLRVFPKLKTDKHQRTSALRWLGVIHWYFKMGWSAQSAAEQLGISAKMVYDSAQRITRAGAGLRTTGKPRAGKRGRPRTRTNYF